MLQDGWSRASDGQAHLERETTSPNKYTITNNNIPSYLEDKVLKLFSKPYSFLLFPIELADVGQVCQPLWTLVSPFREL